MKERRRQTILCTCETRDAAECAWLLHMSKVPCTCQCHQRPETALMRQLRRSLELKQQEQVQDIIGDVAEGLRHDR